MCAWHEVIVCMGIHTDAQAALLFGLGTLFCPVAPVAVLAWRDKCVRRLYSYSACVTVGCIVPPLAMSASELPERSLSLLALLPVLWIIGVASGVVSMCVKNSVQRRR
ncbi:hypothetical protein RAS1_16930 [Phycisphaerae bacterium RAS1]|nr:hypothetical protein RAS1_16930 [Phycisphaerae bacterium RAS1]